MTKKELIQSVLERMNLKYETDDDGDIELRYQMKQIFIIMGDEDENYLSVLLPQFHEIEEDQEAIDLATCNKMTRELKLVKVYVDQTFKNVSASAEFFYTDEESLEQNIRYALQMLSVVRSVFRRSRSELKE